ISASKPRPECLRNLALRTGCAEVESLTARINQAAKFGTNLGHSLRIHSESLRQKRRQEAEERAAKTSVKLLFPLVFFIFPAMFVVILGPAIISLQEFFSE
ncbi:MAG: type II secretion system F family protein, partial [Planctomycetota bacterium]